jgi:uncharacterized FlaG/YvyC family protein
MSAIDPVRRHVLLPHTGTAANLNEPSPVSGKDRGETIEPVKSAHQTDLHSDCRELTFDIDTESDRLIVRVIDEKTRDIVYQDPSDRLVQLARERRHNAGRVP